MTQDYLEGVSLNIWFRVYLEKFSANPKTHGKQKKIKFKKVGFWIT